MKQLQQMLSKNETFQNCLQECKLSNQGIDIIKDIKEKMCYVAGNYYTDIQGEDTFLIDDKSYELPDGNILTIDPELRYTPPEILFK